MCKYLQKFYIETRYPVVWETKYTRQDALEAQKSAHQIIDFVEKLLRK
jgi:HEPN domain-containing protein